MATAGEAFERLVAIMARLRAPDGCPWDKRQTLQSLRQCLVEETYEVLEAIEKVDATEHCEELGDLLMQIVLQTQIQHEAGAFDIIAVVDGICDKMERRHPHIFGDLTLDTPEAVRANWFAIKAVEKAHRESALDGIPTALPALLRAFRLGQKAARQGFDWPDVSGVIDKVDEEAAEVREALAAGDTEQVKRELGDYLFSVVNLCRHLGVDPEAALQSTNHEFSRRFRQIEKGLAAEGKTPKDVDLDELERRWQAAKKTPAASPS